MSEVKPYINEDGEVRELDEHFSKTATRGRPPMPEMERKQRINIMLDPDLLVRLRTGGKGWQTRINAILRQAMKM